MAIDRPQNICLLTYMGLSTGCLTAWALRANTQDQSDSLFIALAQAWHLLTLAIFCSLSAQFSCSVVSNSMWPLDLQHARLPCPTPAPRACWNSCPSSWWCHPTISSSVPFSSCLQSFTLFHFQSVFTINEFIAYTQRKGILKELEYKNVENIGR